MIHFLNKTTQIHANHAKILTHATRAIYFDPSQNFMDPRHPRHFFAPRPPMLPMPKFDSHQPQTYTLTLPAPFTLFGRFDYTIFKIIA